MKHYLLLLLAAASVTFAQTPPASDDSWDFTPDPKLPNVLLIGDSISIGYTRAVRDLLRGKANVYRPMNPDGKSPFNCANTAVGLAHLDEWLGTRKWAVIHFNWGLHDFCYRSTDSKSEVRRDKVHGKPDVALPQYGPNLEKLVAQLEKTGAKLIWASTTFVPEGETCRFSGDEIPYNRVARGVMTRQGIQIDDLHALTDSFPANMFLAPGNVHYTAPGYARIAAQVAAAVETALRERAR